MPACRFPTFLPLKASKLSSSRPGSGCSVSISRASNTYGTPWTRNSCATRRRLRATIFPSHPAVSNGRYEEERPRTRRRSLPGFTASPTRVITTTCRGRSSSWFTGQAITSTRSRRRRARSPLLQPRIRRLPPRPPQKRLRISLRANPRRCLTPSQDTWPSIPSSPASTPARGIFQTISGSGPWTGGTWRYAWTSRSEAIRRYCSARWPRAGVAEEAHAARWFRAAT